MKEGTFLVTHADDESAIVRDVTDGQVLTLAANPGLDTDTLIEATLEPEPPMEVAWTIAELEREFTIDVAESEEPPTQQVRETAADQPVGDLTRHERAGIGEVHVLTVPEDGTEDAIADVMEDEGTVERAARLGVDRVEIRAEPGMVSVRYLP